MKSSLETRLGMFFALALVAAVIVIELTGGASLFNRGHRINAFFQNIQDLKEGDPVKMAGYAIGRVEQIGLDEGRVRVVMRIKKGEIVRSDSRATIKFTGLLGQNFVAVSFGTPTAPELVDGQVIETAELPDFGSLMAKLDGLAGGFESLTKTFSGEGFQGLMAPLADFIKENSPRLSATFENLRNISGQIASGQGTVGQLVYDDALIRNANTTVSNLNTELTLTTTEVRELLENANAVVAEVRAGKGTIGKLTTDEALFNDAALMMLSLREVVERINQGQGTVGRLVNDESFFRNIKMTLQKVEKATEGFEDQGALGVLSIAVGALF